MLYWIYIQSNGINILWNIPLHIYYSDFHTTTIIPRLLPHDSIMSNSLLLLYL